MRHRAAILVLILGAALVAVPSRSQSFGRWWWEASLGLRQQSFDNTADGEETSSYDQRDLELRVGINGYIVHPAVAAFRLGLEYLFSDFATEGSTDNQNLGLRADVRVLPTGAYPMSFFFSSRTYDYRDLGAEGPFTLLGSPDRSTSWGGRIRARRGPLRGLLFGFSRSSLDFFDPDSRPEIDDRQFVDWGRTGKRFQHHIRAERRFQEFGLVDLTYENFTFNAEERGQLTPNWRWDLSAVAVRRDNRFSGTPSRLDNAWLRNRFVRPIRGKDLLDLSYNLGIFKPENVGTRKRHDLDASYRWYPKPRLEVVPFARFGYLTAEDVSLSGPSLGVTASRAFQFVKWGATVRGQVSYGILRGEEASLSRDETQLGYGLGGSLAHGDSQGLRKELELDITHSEVNTEGDPLLDVPELGVLRFGLGAEDSARSRLTLEHRWGSRSLTAWGQWQLRESSGDLTPQPFKAEALTGSLQFSGPDFNLMASYGATAVRTEIETGRIEDEVGFFGAAATWRPWRFMAVRANYRTDTRRLVLTPDIDGDRYEIGLDIGVGLFSIEAWVFQTFESLADGPERENSGFRWALRRRFAGWLPIVTGPQRRGKIR